MLVIKILSCLLKYFIFTRINLNQTIISWVLPFIKNHIYLIKKNIFLFNYIDKFIINFWIYKLENSVHDNF